MGEFKTHGADLFLTGNASGLKFGNSPFILSGGSQGFIGTGTLAPQPLYYCPTHGKFSADGVHFIDGKPYCFRCYENFLKRNLSPVEVCKEAKP